jgi:DNA topoisomerase-1
VEEFVVQFADMVARDHPHTKNAAFVANFDTDLKSMWRPASSPKKSGGDGEGRARDWNWDFVIDQIRQKREKAIKSRKGQRKKAEAEAPTVRIDGQDYATSRNVVDKPGIFIGRGERHPLNGRIRRRIRASDVSLNLSRDASVPVPPKGSGGKAWREVLHDPCVSWLSRWEDPLTGSMKYVYVDGSSAMRQHHERRKFDKARELKRHLPEILAAMDRDMTQTEDAVLSQLAACARLIEIFGIRSGNDTQRSDQKDDEDDDDEESGGTVGATSLRKRNVMLRVLPKTGEKEVRLRFVGKDHISFDDSKVVPIGLFDRLSSLKRKKNDSDDDLLFNHATADAVNRYLDALLPGLTCKVMRTHRASRLVDMRLSRATSSTVAPSHTRTQGKPKEKDDRLKRDLLAVVLLEAAWLMNHKKKTTFIRASEKDDMERKHTALHATFGDLCDAVWDSVIALAGSRIKIQNDKNNARQHQQLLDRTQEARRVAAELHLAPQTAKVNYIDPRIVMAYCKRVGLSNDRAYNSGQLSRFSWAATAPANFAF